MLQARFGFLKTAFILLNTMRLILSHFTQCRFLSVNNFAKYLKFKKQEAWIMAVVKIVE